MLGVSETEQLPVPQAKAGDATAWAALFQRYQLPLYVYVFELVRDEQASLDVVQETFISAVRNIGGLRTNEKFRTALMNVSRSEEHTSELQSHSDLVCRLLLEKKKNKKKNIMYNRN